MSGRVTRSQLKRQQGGEGKAESASNGGVEVTSQKKAKRGKKDKAEKTDSKESSATIDDAPLGSIVVRPPPPPPAVPVANTIEEIKAKHQKFDDESEVEPRKEQEPMVKITNGDDSAAEDKAQDTAISQEEKEEEEESDDDEAPEAFSLSTGREIEAQRIADEKKALEQQATSARLKRKAIDARLKEQKLQSQPQAKRQKITPSAISTTTATPVLAAAAASSSNQNDGGDSDSAEPSDSNTGITSPASSRTLSLQLPPSSQFPNPIIHNISDRKSKPPLPLLLPAALLEEVASRPSPPPEDTTTTSAGKSNNQSGHKKLADFEAEEKAAQLASFLKKKSNSTPVYKKGQFRVAVIGKEEEKERERKIMAPPKAKKIANIKSDWLTKRGVERRVVPVGKLFARR
ncbi:hypothetical protein DFH27DRAFT_564149 [Peziza echinospora]|nr:hypothetical protein DFH27DRAFT_564149 [Peziza echinospora]